MKQTFQRIFMGICLHVLLTGFLLAGMHVYRSSYDQTHTEPLTPASLHLTADTAELTILSQTLTLPRPDSHPRIRLLGYALTNSPVKLWFCLLRNIREWAAEG